MSDNKYWQGFGEFKEDSENFKKQVQDEFREELPLADLDDKGLLDAKAPRRDFLKYLGFSTAAAALAAGCKTPVREAIPFANKPENIIPGEAKFYATTYVQDGDAIPVLAKVRDGRPIKIEGNDLCSYTKGGTTARAQASVLDLYDTHRLTHPMQKKGQGWEELPTYKDVDDKLTAALATAGKPIVLLSSTIVSPSTKQIITEFINKYPGSRHVQVDAVSYSGMLLANEASGFGRKLPTYNFGAANVIVGLGADFLGTWLSPVENANGYTKGRKIDEKHPQMSKHIQFEPYLTNTGGAADYRYSHRPSETGAIALALLAALDGSVAAPALADKKLQDGINKAAGLLKANHGTSLVVCGSNDVNVQVVVNAINNSLGANGTTIDWSKPVNYRQGIDKDLDTLITDMEAGNVGAVLIAGANPAYTWHDGERFKKALAKVKTTVAFSEKMDETARECAYIVPTHHYLESWGDAEPKAGHISFMQPAINPLFKTRPYQTSLLKWAGNNTDYETYLKTYWAGKLGSDEAYEKALQDGVVEPGGVKSAAHETSTASHATVDTGHHTTAHQPAPPVVVKDTATVVTPVTIQTTGPNTYSGTNLQTAVAAITGYKPVSGDEVVLYEKVSIGSGIGATNPWLQELPDGITRATWDNYAMISISKAKELLGVDLSATGSEKGKNKYEYYPSKPVITLKVAGKKDVSLPILVIPGMNSNTVAVAVGYGRHADLGKTAAGVGIDVYPLSSFNGTTVGYSAPVTLADGNDSQKIAQTQIHNSYEGRLDVVRETTLATFKTDPNVIVDYRAKMQHEYAKSTNDFRREATMYPDHEQPGIKWGMTVDMNACYGCGACVVACHTENNVPVVGKSEVLRYHDMHWLRIDRYFISSKENPDDLKGVVFQPMMCQHCDNAPCENVCPVAATNHSTEGINQMAYNRCIGTRYCANNCPFKVRRFNWADYTGADSFPNNQDQQLVGKLDPVVHQMNDELSRMVLNPDVTVRSRGVMEKCTFCIQRTQAGKLQAKKEGRAVKDGEVKTACQQACAADAIVFGNVHDPHSQVTQIRLDNPQRSFYVLEQLHVLPNVTYLAKVRNTDDNDIINEKDRGRTKLAGFTAAGGGHGAEKHEGGGEHH